jgi:epoxyqueuosine reductase
MSDPQGLEGKVRERAAALGASLVGFTPVRTYPEYVQEVQKRAAERHFKVEDYRLSPKSRDFLSLYEDPRKTLPSVHSIVLVGAYSLDDSCNYTTATKDLRGKIARTYAYYPVVRSIAESLAAFLRQELGFEAVHTENLPLKIAAVDMGLATYGENGVLLSKEYGSYFALCGVLTSAVLHPEAGPIEDQCTHCGACRRACPTRALYKPYALDPMLCVNAVARRSTPIEEPLRGKIGSWFRGCDVCQEVCPKNRPLVARSADARSGYDSLSHSPHIYLDGLERLPRLLPLLDAGQPFLMRRNAAIVLGNIGRGDPEVLKALRHHAANTGGELKSYLLWALQRNEQRALGSP